jgi:hypothetical protein
VGEVLGELACRLRGKKNCQCCPILRQIFIQRSTSWLAGSIWVVHTSGSLNGHDSRTNVNLHYTEIQISPGSKTT